MTSPLLLLILKDQSVTLKIRKQAGGVDFVELPYYHDLDGVLISGLDKLLKKNRINPKVLKTYKIQGNLGKDRTSYKIASSFLAALKIN